MEPSGHVLQALFLCVLEGRNTTALVLYYTLHYYLLCNENSRRVAIGKEKKIVLILQRIVFSSFSRFYSVARA